MSNEKYLVTSLVTDAIKKGVPIPERQALNRLENTLYGYAVVHCWGCGEVIGAFPPGVVHATRDAQCDACGGGGWFYLRKGAVIASGHCHDRGNPAHECDACNGQMPPLMPWTRPRICRG